MRAARYAFEEAWASLLRSRSSGLLSTATIALALVVLGGVLLATSNLDRLAAEWGSAPQMSVYLADDVTTDQREAVEAELAPGPTILGREYVSKADAAARFKKMFSGLSTTMDGLGENPLPASYEVQLRPESEARGDSDALAAKLRQLPGVSDVRYDRQWIGRLTAAVNVVRELGFVLALILTLAAAFTVANVIRLALFARRDEIEIMRLVGAPHAFIRGPFVAEGFLQGGLGAVLALILLVVGFAALKARYLGPLAAAINLSSIRFLPAELCLLLVVGGMAVGSLGGLVAAWFTES